MKRTALIAIMIAALAFGAVGFAIAEVSDSVTITATVNPAFSLAVTDELFAFGPLSVGDLAETETTDLIVKSNRPWTFTKAVGYNDDQIADFLTESSLLEDLTGAVVTESAAGRARGVTRQVVSYTLDLSDETDASAVWNLDPKDYTATYTYTAVQE